jgi:fucose permease
VLSTKPSYAVILTAYFLVGIGTGFGDSSFCTWAAGLREADKISGLIHGSYALGCVTGPIIVAALVKAELGWQSFYMVLVRWNTTVEWHC